MTQKILVGPGPQGISVDRHGVWVGILLDGSLVRLDSRTGRVAQRIALGGGAGAEGVASDGRSVWVADYNGASVIRVDAATGRVLGHALTGPQPRGIAVGAGGAWVANSAGSTLSHVVPR